MVYYFKLEVVPNHIQTSLIFGHGWFDDKRKLPASYTIQSRIPGFLTVIYV